MTLACPCVSVFGSMCVGPSRPHNDQLQTQVSAEILSFYSGRARAAHTASIASSRRSTLNTPSGGLALFPRRPPCLPCRHEEASHALSFSRKFCQPASPYPGVPCPQHFTLPPLYFSCRASVFALRQLQPTLFSLKT